MEIQIRITHVGTRLRSNLTVERVATFVTSTYKWFDSGKTRKFMYPLYKTMAYLGWLSTLNIIIRYGCQV